MDRIERTGVGPASQDRISRTARRSTPRDVARSHQEIPSPDAAGEPTLAEKARLISRLSQAVDEAPDVREDRVKQLQQAVEDGSYQIDNAEIARRLLGIGDE